MDNKIINQKTSKKVKFVNFLFRPHFNIEESKGEICLAFEITDVEGTGITSYVKEIHEIDGIVYVETRNSLYELDGSEEHKDFTAIKEFLKGDISRTEFLQEYVPNKMPTKYGWMVY